MQNIIQPKARSTEYSMYEFSSKVIMIRAWNIFLVFYTVLRDPLSLFNREVINREHRKRIFK